MDSFGVRVLKSYLIVLNGQFWCMGTKIIFTSFMNARPKINIKVLECQLCAWTDILRLFNLHKLTLDYAFYNIISLIWINWPIMNILTINNAIKKFLNLTCKKCKNVYKLLTMFFLSLTLLKYDNVCRLWGNKIHVQKCISKCSFTN